MNQENHRLPRETEDEERDHRRPGLGVILLRRAWKRKITLVALVFLVIIVSTGLLAPWITPCDPNAQNLRARLKPPVWSESGSSEHLFGTDQLGRDVLSRVIKGSQISIGIALAAIVVSGLLGVVLGMASGFYQGVFDTVLMRIADVQLAFPPILLAIAVIAVLGPSVRNLVLVLGVTGWVTYARVVRAETLVIGNGEFVLAARAMGMSDMRIMLFHILPNLVPSGIVVLTTQVARVIITEASLSFLGLGVPVTTPTWGGMLSDAQAYMTTAPWLATIPGVVMMLTILAINLTGDLFRDVLDPKIID